MQPMFAPLPELHLLDADAESAPETRQRHFPLLEFLLQLEEFALQDPRAEMRLDCWETQAPIWLSRGRLWKYLTTSSVDKRSALPITITWRSSICHGNSRLTWGFFSI